MSHPKQQAINNALNPSKFKSRAEEVAYNNNPKNFTSKKELKASKERTKNWPKHNPKGSVAWPKTDEQKREHQARFGRAWND